jgi:hypothetical protein
MGQFTTRPEEPTEWAGLPSEPLESRPAAESLAAPIESADSLAFLGGPIESVVIPLAPPGDIDGPAEPAESDPRG